MKQVNDEVQKVYAAIDAANSALVGTGYRITKWIRVEEPKAVPVPAPALQQMKALSLTTHRDDGMTCPECGGMMARTGTCMTCQSCANSSGGCS